MENMTDEYNEPECTCGHAASSHEHGASLTPTFECDKCDCPDFEENFTKPLFDVNEAT
jgi:hypothetical protein